MRGSIFLKTCLNNNQGKGRLQKIAQVIGNVLVVVSIIFIVRIIIKLGISQEILQTIIEHWPVLLFAVLLWVAYVYISAFGWNRILAFLEGKDIPYSEICNIYVKSNIGKYVPGNVMHLVGRNILGARYNISQSNMAISTVLEIGLSVLSAIFYAVLFARNNLWVILEHFNARILAVAVPILVVLGIISVYVLRKKLLEIVQNIILPFTLKKFWNALVILQIFLLNYLLMGSIFFLTARYVCGFGDSIPMMSIIGIFLLSWLAGYITPGASGGLGVREIILLTLLSPFYSRESIVTVIVIHRVVTTMGDIAAYLFILLIGRMGKIKEETGD